MIRLPPPKNAAGKAGVVEPTLAPPASISSAMVAQSLDVVSRGRTNVKAAPMDLRPAGPGAASYRDSVVSQQEAFDTEKTASALAQIVEAKVAVSNQTQITLNAALPQKSSTFVKVNGTSDALTGKVTQDRVFRMVEKAVDPLEPAKHRFRAVPKGPGSPPVPILHSPPKKATDEEKAAWNVPASISNWKNSKGYVITLDKRLAQTAPMEAPAVNDRFAHFAEALLSAEDSKRVEVNERAKMRQINEEKAREAENEALRIAAAEARAARANAALTHATGANAIPVVSASRPGSDTPPMPARVRSSSPSYDRVPEERSKRSKRSISESSGSGEDDEVGRQERDRLRNEKRRELEREMRLAAAGKRTKAMREEERDISERVSLGMPVPKSMGSFETEFDQRLFNRGGAGISSGRGEDQEDEVYSTSLFRDKTKDGHRPSSQLRETRTQSELQSKLDQLKGGESKFVMESHGFKGSESTAQNSSRHGPVQFERSAAKPVSESDDILAGIALSAPRSKPTGNFSALSSDRVTGSLSAGRFAGDANVRKIQHSMDEPSEQEIHEERLISKLKEKESRSKQVAFVKSTES